MNLHPSAQPRPAFFSLRGSSYSYTPRRERCATLDAEGAAAMFERWNAALATGDAETVAALYSEDAVLLPTFSWGPLKGWAAIADYSAIFFSNNCTAASTAAPCN